MIKSYQVYLLAGINKGERKMSYKNLSKKAITKLNIEDKVDYWKTKQVLKILSDNMTWGGDCLFINGFENNEIKGMTQETDFSYFEMDKLDSWIQLSKWLMDYVFNKDGLNLEIIKSVCWNYGDEGGVGIVIVLANQEDDNGVEVRGGKDFESDIAFGIKPKKPYYISIQTL